jgi:hypothetical protein
MDVHRVACRNLDIDVNIHWICRPLSKILAKIGCTTYSKKSLVWTSGAIDMDPFISCVETLTLVYETRKESASQSSLLDNLQTS